MTSTDPRKIAEGLTAAGRRALLNRDSYCDPNTTRSLRKRGLLRGSQLTAIGLEVRAILEKEKNDG